MTTITKKEAFKILEELTIKIEEIAIWDDVTIDVEWLVNDLIKHGYLLVCFKHVLSFFKEQDFPLKREFFDIYEYDFFENAKKCLLTKLSIIDNYSIDGDLGQKIKEMKEFIECL